MRALGRATWALLSLGAGLGLAVVAFALAVYSAGNGGPPAEALDRSRPANALALAVMGDSDSHSYQDRLAFPPGSDARGGDSRARTFNWVETLARLRASELDPGPWLAWGSGGRMSSVRRIFGLPVGRVPTKEDFLHNFSYSGARCDDLMAGPFRQAPWLAALMQKEPERWRNGIVVIRMGLNDMQSMLDLQASEPDAPRINEAISRCQSRIAEAIAQLRERQPGLKFLIVGMGNEIDDPGQFESYRSAEEVNNTDEAMERFNGALRDLAERTPGAAFFDQDAWFRQRWGSRSADGLPDTYKTVTIGDSFKVTNTAGDDPHNALLNDHHAGTVWNALWAQSIVLRLREAFALPLTPIGDDELWRYVGPLVRPHRLKAPGS